MPHWILTALDHRSEIWQVYPVQRIVVEATDEGEARKKVAAAAAGCLCVGLAATPKEKGGRSRPKGVLVNGL